MTSGCKKSFVIPVDDPKLASEVVRSIRMASSSTRRLHNNENVYISSQESTDYHVFSNVGELNRLIVESKVNLKQKTDFENHMDRAIADYIPSVPPCSDEDSIFSKDGSWINSNDTIKTHHPIPSMESTRNEIDSFNKDDDMSSDDEYEKDKLKSHNKVG